MGEKSGWLGRFVSEWEKTVSHWKKNPASRLIAIHAPMPPTLTRRRAISLRVAAHLAEPSTIHNANAIRVSYRSDQAMILQLQPSSSGRMVRTV